MIFKKGDRGNQAYLLQSGRIEVLDEDGNILSVIGPGGILGEMALIDNKPRSAGARAVESTTVVVVNRQMFEDKLARTDPFIRGLLKILASTVRRHTEAAQDAAAQTGQAGGAPPEDLLEKPPLSE